MTKDGALFVANFNLCVTGACSNSSGCYPLPLVPCDGGADQAFTYHADSKALVSNATGKCLDVYGDSGPNVGLYSCSGSMQQQWRLDSATSQISSNMTGTGFTQCLTDGGRSSSLNVYTDGAAVDLYINGVHRQNASVDYYQFASVSLPYEPGTLVAVSRDAQGKVLSNHTRYTPGDAVALRLSIDAPSPETGTGRAVYLDGQVIILINF